MIMASRNGAPTLSKLDNAINQRLIEMIRDELPLENSCVYEAINRSCDKRLSIRFPSQIMMQLEIAIKKIALA